MHACDLPVQLSCYDVAQFPLVAAHWPHLAAQKSVVWHDDTAQLVESGHPFVMLVHAMPNDRKERLGATLRGFKSFSLAFANCCRAVIVIEPDPSRRAMMRLDTNLLERSFGTDVYMSPDEHQAALLSQRLLETPPLPLSAR